MVTNKNNDKMNAKKYYRVCHKDTFQGLWYNFKGEFTGLIHGQLNFVKPVLCKWNLTKQLWAGYQQLKT